jgi:hypothetical protein
MEETKARKLFGKLSGVVKCLGAKFCHIKSSDKRSFNNGCENVTAKSYCLDSTVEINIKPLQAIKA